MKRVKLREMATGIYIYIALFWFCICINRTVTEQFGAKLAGFDDAYSQFLELILTN